MATLDHDRTWGNESLSSPNIGYKIVFEIPQDKININNKHKIFNSNANFADFHLDTQILLSTYYTKKIPILNLYLYETNSVSTY